MNRIMDFNQNLSDSAVKGEIPFDVSNDEFEVFDEITAFIEQLKDDSVEDGKVEYLTVCKAEQIWYTIIEDFGYNIPVPIVSLGFEGEILFTFQKDEDYLEIEVCKDKYILFFENRERDEMEFNESYLSEQLFEHAEKYLTSFN